MTNTKDGLIKDFLGFSSAANLRSTVDIKDGLKPVHRRILYSLAVDFKRKKEGSAKVVGTIMGEYHPHGDTSVYDAAVRLAQDFKTRYPLIDFKGSLGSLSDPKGYASMRYTSMGISKLGVEVVENHHVADKVETYTGDRMEPAFLVGKVPITLLNGTTGIGVGMASQIPPHNLREVANAIEHRIDNPESTTKDIMQFIKGPDFPTGGTIANPEAILDMYETGSGSVRIKADYRIETIKGKTHIIITEVPYLVDPNKGIIGKIKEMYEEGYEYIEDIVNDSGHENPFLLSIILTKDAPVFQVIERILTETSIETTFSVNLTTHIGDNKFQRNNLLGLLDLYVSQNLEMNKRAKEFERQKYLDRKHIVDGLIKASNNIDEVVKTIKASRDTVEASSKLKVLLTIDDIQAKAILAMRLSQLTKLDVNKLSNELQDLITKINKINEFLESKTLQLELIKTNIQELSFKYGDERRTRIKTAGEVGESEEVTVFLNKNNELFAMETKDVPENRRNTKGKVFDDLISVASSRSDGSVLVATSTGLSREIPVASIGVSAEMHKTNVAEFGITDKAVKVFEVTPSDYVLTVTNVGTIKKSEYNDYKFDKNPRLCKVRETEELKEVYFVNKGDKIAYLIDGKIVAFDESEIKVSGVNTLGTKASSHTVSKVAVVSDYLLVISGDGNGKKIKPKDLSEGSRKGAGNKANEAIAIHGLEEGGFAYIWGEDGRMIRIKESSISTSKSISSVGILLYRGNIGKSLT